MKTDPKPAAELITKMLLMMREQYTDREIRKFLSRSNIRSALRVISDDEEHNGNN